MCRTLVKLTPVVAAAKRRGKISLNIFDPLFHLLKFSSFLPFFYSAMFCHQNCTEKMFEKISFQLFVQELNVWYNLYALKAQNKISFKQSFCKLWWHLVFVFKFAEKLFVYSQISRKKIDGERSALLVLWLLAKEELSTLQQAATSK